MKESGRLSGEKQGMDAEEVRAFREQERMDSVYLDRPSHKKALYTALNYCTAALTGAVILVALYYGSLLTGYLFSAILPYFDFVDDSAGFLADLVTAVLHLLLFGIIAILFGFALDINYKGHGRPKEVWGKDVKYILPAAFGSCVLYVVIHHFTSGGSFTVSGSLLSQILYYFTAIAVVPDAADRDLRYKRTDGATADHCRHTDNDFCHAWNYPKAYRQLRRSDICLHADPERRMQSSLSPNQCHPVHRTPVRGRKRTLSDARRLIEQFHVNSQKRADVLHDESLIRASARFFTQLFYSDYL